MIIVSNTTGGNTINFIPRDGTNAFLDRVIGDGGAFESENCIGEFASRVQLTDEVTGDVVVEYPMFSRLGYLTQSTLLSTLKDQRRYLMVILDINNKELYRDIIFCSTQSIADYSITNGELDFQSAPTEVTPQYIIID